MPTLFEGLNMVHDTAWASFTFFRSLFCDFHFHLTKPTFTEYQKANRKFLLPLFEQYETQKRLYSFNNVEFTPNIQNKRRIATATPRFCIFGVNSDVKHQKPPKSRQLSPYPSGFAVGLSALNTNCSFKHSNPCNA